MSQYREKVCFRGD